MPSRLFANREMTLRTIGKLAMIATLAVPFAALTALHAQSGQYHITNRFKLGGDCSWDYLAFDTVGNRLFIARENRVMVVDPVNGKLLGEIKGLNRAHGIAFAYRAGHGFATSGGDSTVYMFDLKTLRVIGKTVAAVDDDAILYDKVSNRIFTMNGDAGSSSVIDPVTGKLITNIPLDGKPEFGVSGGNGKVYANIEDKSQVVEIDTRAMKVVRRWPLAPCVSPSGLAIDRAHMRLFSGCHSKVMAISDIKRGAVVGTVPIGSGIDANKFDPGTGLAFSSNGDGTITVAHETKAGMFAVLQTISTMPAARTMTVDLKTHKLYTVSAEFGPAPAQVAGARRQRPPVIPGSFVLIEMSR
jgi:hypothetical protein